MRFLNAVTKDSFAKQFIGSEYDGCVWDSSDSCVVCSEKFKKDIKLDDRLHSDCCSEKCSRKFLSMWGKQK